MFAPYSRLSEGMRLESCGGRGSSVSEGHNTHLHDRTEVHAQGKARTWTQGLVMAAFELGKWNNGGVRMFKSVTKQ